MKTTLWFLSGAFTGAFLFGQIAAPSPQSIYQTVPSSILAEHKELHKELQALTTLKGSTGEQGRVIAQMLETHFQDEESFAMPPLTGLRQVASGVRPQNSAALITASKKLKSELPRMLADHKKVGEQLVGLAYAAIFESQPEALRFVDRLMLHARMEEEILYPAAILVGDYLEKTAPK